MEKEGTIIIRIKPSEKEEIKAKALEAGLGISEYIRKMALNGSVIKVDAEDKRALNGIANNLNQLSRFTNQTHSVHPEVNAVLEETIKKIRNAYRKR